MEIILEDVPISQLRYKLAAWELLTDYTCSVEVKGEFLDKDGEIAFLHRDFCAVEHHSIKRFDEYIEVYLPDEGWVKLTPRELIIKQVRLKRAYKLS